MVIRIQTRDNEPVDKALRRLRKLCNNEGLTRVSKRNSYFEKPSDRRRRESRERAKAIRLSTRAREQDHAKLLQRRRKARKQARLAAIQAAQAQASTERGEVSEVLAEAGAPVPPTPAPAPAAAPNTPTESSEHSEQPTGA